jgi:hypothetical protein
MRALAFSIAALFASAPAFAEEAVVVPNDNGRTVIHEDGPFHDKTTIIDHRKPDTVVVPEEHRDYDSNGAGSGDVGSGVDIETHDRVAPPPPDDDR